MKSLNKFLGPAALLAAFVCGVLFVAGIACDGGVGTGILIGAGSSAAAMQWQQDMQKKKAELVAEVQSLRVELETAETDEQKQIILGKIEAVETTLASSEFWETIVNKVGEGLSKDWQSRDPPVLTENIHWLIDSILLGFYGWQKRKTRVYSEATTSFMARQPETVSVALRENLNIKNNKIIP